MEHSSSVTNNDVNMVKEFLGQKIRVYMDSGTVLSGILDLVQKNRLRILDDQRLAIIFLSHVSSITPVEATTQENEVTHASAIDSSEEDMVKALIGDHVRVFTSSGTVLSGRLTEVEDKVDWVKVDNEKNKALINLEHVACITRT